MELTAATGAAFVSHSYPIEKVITVGHTVEPKRTINLEEALDTISKINKKIILKQSEQALAKHQRATVARIINEDKGCLYNENKDKLAYDIVKIAKEYDSDPIAIACIIKRETHFALYNNSSTGKGAMQLTKMPIKDMFERSQLYDKRLIPIITAYPTYNNLYEAIQKNPSLNIRVGTILFKHYLTAAKGNMKTALKNYNGSSIKEKYASEVYKDIQKYNKLLNKAKG